MSLSDTPRATIRDSPLSDVELHLVDNLDEALALRTWIGQRRDTPVGYDTETSGFNPFKGELRLAQLGDTRHGWAIPYDTWGGFVLETLNKYEGPLVMHNSSFDVKWTQVHSGGKWTPPWDRIDDTMAMAHLDDPTRPRALKALADREVDPRASAGQSALSDGMKKQHWTWATVPVDFAPYWVYAALDPVLTAHIWKKKKSVLTEFRDAYQIEMSATRIATQMMMHGALIDVPYTEKAIEKLKAYALECRDWLKAFGVTSPMSSGQIGKVAENYGVDIAFFTDSGQPSFDKSALAYYIEMYPAARTFFETVRSTRQTEKIIGTYLENFLEMRDSDDRLHPSLWVNAAKTSRMSCSEPNLQNLIRDDKVVRGAIIPAERFVLMSIDADQIEARMAAHFSQDPGLIEAFRLADETGADFFSIIASEIYQTEIVKKDKRRQRTKNTFYAKIYGASTAKMAITAGVPVDQMAAFHLALNNRYPGLEHYMDSTIAESRMHSHRGMPAVYTPTGRRLLATPGKEYALANFKIQGHAAEILKLGMTRLDAAGFGDYMVVPVHDEVIFEVPEDQAEEMLHVAEETLADRTSYSVPITWGGDIMRERWVKS